VTGNDLAEIAAGLYENRCKIRKRFSLKPTGDLIVVVTGQHGVGV